MWNVAEAIDVSPDWTVDRSPVGDFSPHWSPDGKRLAYVSYWDGNAEVFVMLADETKPVNLSNALSLDRDPVWVP